MSRLLESPRHLAVLGLLLEAPTYVYDLAKRYDERFGDFEPLHESAVYRVVDRQEKEGLLERTATESDGRRAAAYRATPEGARAYVQALSEGLSHDPGRLMLVTRMLSAATTGGRLGLVTAVLDQYEADCLAEAPKLKPPRTTDPATAELVTVVRELLLEHERLMVGVRISWVEYARKRLTRFAADAGEQ